MRVFSRFLPIATCLVVVCSACAGTSRQSNGSGTTHAGQSVDPLDKEATEDDLIHRSSIRNYDCNTNGIPDSIDIKLGYVSDTNRNGQIDGCDSDEGLAYAARAGNHWWRFAERSDSVYFEVIHSARPPITIRYTVPPKGGDVALSVLDASGNEVTRLVDEFQVEGPFVLQWDRKVAGRAVPHGEYTFRLRVAGQRLERKMAWRNLI